MRKIIILILLILFCDLCLNNQKTKTKTVFNEEDNNYHIYTLNVQNANITTINIESFFSNYTIISIEPMINPIYKNIINLNKYHFNTTKSITKNIKNFNELYMKYLQDNALTEEENNFNYNGLKISSIKLYTSQKNLNNILLNPNIKVDF